MRCSPLGSNHRPMIMSNSRTCSIIGTQTPHAHDASTCAACSINSSVWAIWCSVVMQGIRDRPNDTAHCYYSLYRTIIFTLHQVVKIKKLEVCSGRFFSGTSHFRSGTLKIFWYFFMDQCTCNVRIWICWDGLEPNRNQHGRVSPWR